MSLQLSPFGVLHPPEYEKWRWRRVFCLVSLSDFCFGSLSPSYFVTLHFQTLNKQVERLERFSTNFRWTTDKQCKNYRQQCLGSSQGFVTELLMCYFVHIVPWRQLERSHSRRLVTVFFMSHFSFPQKRLKISKI
jgi:hypothetical protein